MGLDEVDDGRQVSPVVNGRPHEERVEPVEIEVCRVRDVSNSGLVTALFDGGTNVVGDLRSLALLTTVEYEEGCHGRDGKPYGREAQKSASEI